MTRPGHKQFALRKALIEGNVIAKRLYLLLPVLLIAACNRDTPPATTQASTTETQEAPVDMDGGLEGRMAFHIVNVYSNQQPVDEYPGHAEGGTWTFMDCMAGDVPFVIGIQAIPPSAPGLPPEVEETLTESSVRGRAVLRVPGREGSEAFLGAFASGFHTGVPEPLSPRPVLPEVFNTVLVGSEMARSADGRGLVVGQRGSWTSARWLVATPRLHSEMYFNYDLTSGQGEFVEKDAGSRDELVTLWARILRDGPRGLRSPQEDSNIVSTGPRAGNGVLVAGPEAYRPFFVPGNKWLIYTAVQKGKLSQVWEVEVAHPENRHLLAELPEVYQVQSSDAEGRHVLVEEKIPDVPGMVSSADPSRFWWIDTQAEAPRVLGGPWKARDVDLGRNAISPDSRFIVVAENRTRADRQGGFTVLHIVDLQANAANSLDINEHYLEAGPWVMTDAGLRLVVRTGLPVDAPASRGAALVDPSSGNWAAAQPGQVPPVSNTMLISPDGQNAAELVERQKLEIHRVTGITRQLMFHPEDRVFADDGSVAWLDGRYMSFFNPYPLIIDTSIMKMSYLLQTDRPPRDVRYSPDFKYAAIMMDDGLYLAPIVGGR